MQEDQGRHDPGEEGRHGAGVEAAHLANILGPVIDARGWGWCCGSSRPCLSHAISRRPHTCTADVTDPQLLTEDDLGLRLAAARCCCRCWRCCAAETQIQDLAQALSTGDADLWRSVTRDRRMGCTSRLPGLLVQRGIHGPRRGCLSVSSNPGKPDRAATRRLPPTYTYMPWLFVSGGVPGRRDHGSMMRMPTRQTRADFP